jgi:hypothetical protein
MAGREAAGAPRRRDRARPRTAVGGAAPAVARPVAAAGTLFGQSLLGYISPEPARLNGNTFPAACLPTRREDAQTMRRVRRVSPPPNRAFDRSRLLQHGRIFRSSRRTSAQPLCTHVTPLAAVLRVLSVLLRPATFGFVLNLIRPRGRLANRCIPSTVGMLAPRHLQ